MGILDESAVVIVVPRGIGKIRSSKGSQVIINKAPLNGVRAVEVTNKIVGGGAIESVLMLSLAGDVRYVEAGSPEHDQILAEMSKDGAL